MWRKMWQLSSPLVVSLETEIFWIRGSDNTTKQQLQEKLYVKK